jgi:hypothetical protein
MEESPLYEEIKDEGRREIAHQYILQVLKLRFGPSAAREFASRVKAITDTKQLDRLYRFTIRCGGIEQYRGRFQKS